MVPIQSPTPSDDIPDFGGLAATKQDDGSYLVDITKKAEDKENEAPAGYDNSKDNFYRNLVGEIDAQTLVMLGQQVLTSTRQDETARTSWTSTAELGFDLLGLKVQEKNTPFRGACSAQHPLLLESAVKFQSKASNELLPAAGPAKAQVLGDATEEKELRGNRVKAHMNYQLIEEMTEFYPDTERMLLYVPIFGSAFKKNYYDAYAERPVSEFVPANQFVVPSQATDLHRAERYTHILSKSSQQLEMDFASGLYEKPEFLSAATQLRRDSLKKHIDEQLGVAISQADAAKTYNLYEQHGLYCIHKLDPWKGKEEFDLASPYIVTVNADNGEVLGVRRNWEENDEKRKKIVQFVHYQFVPGFDFYGLGFIHLLGNLQLSLTAALRSLIDAGQFANLQGGFKLKGVRIVNDGDPVSPGQFKDIDSAVMDINKAIFPFPFKEPSTVLFQMLEFLDVKGQKFADSTEQVIQDATNQGPVGTTLALLDASTKFFSAIHKRLHASLKEELQIIAKINAETLPDDLEYNLTNQTMKISKEDYDLDSVGVVPVSDPNISSNAHRMAKSQTILQVAQSNPQFHDMREALKQFYVNMDFPDIDKILPMPQQAQPQDPITDLQSVNQGLPIKAFPGQDHDSHIQIKQAFVQQPQIVNNPTMGKLIAAVNANIQEHYLEKFIEEVQAQAQQDAQAAQGNGQLQGPAAMGPAVSGGAQQPPAMAGQPDMGPQGGSMPQKPADPLAQAAAKVAAMNLQKAQAQAQQGQQQDPKAQANLIMAHAEIQNAQTNAQKAQADAALRAKKLQLDEAALAHKHTHELYKQQGGMQKEINQSTLLDKKHANAMSTLDAKHAQQLETIRTKKGLDMIHDSAKPQNSHHTLELKHQKLPPPPPPKPSKTD